MPPDIGYELLEKLVAALDGVPWWLEFGCLVGAAREQVLLHWDADVDFGCRKEDWPDDGVTRLMAAGFTVERIRELPAFAGSWPSQFVGVRGQSVDQIRFRYRGLRAELVLWHSGVEQWEPYRFITHRSGRVTHAPEGLVKAGGSVTFRNGITVPAPEQIHENLDYFYGKWRRRNSNYIGSPEHKANKDRRVITPEPLVLTCGVWDLLHRGHRNLLKEARRQADCLVVGVQSDEGVIASKGRKPVRSQRMRMEDIKNLGVADWIIGYESGTTGHIMSRVKPTIYMHGKDWLTAADRSRPLKVLKRHGGRLVLLPRTPGISTTQLRKQGPWS